MPAIYKDSDAPGPLVKRSDLVPDVALGKDVKLGQFADNVKSPSKMVAIGVISFVSALGLLPDEILRAVESRQIEDGRGRA